MLASRRFERVQCLLKQKPEALHDWFFKLSARFSGQKVAIAIEQSKGAVINFLLGFDFVHIFRINPKSLKNYRDALSPSGAKDDPGDAELLLCFAKLHCDRLKPWTPDDAKSRTLLKLVEFRRKTVNNRTRLTNALTQLLKEYFPQALEWAGDLDRAMACDFLSKWPTLEKLQRAREGTIGNFYYQHRCRRTSVVGPRLEQIRKALPLTRDPAVIEASIIMVQTYVGQLRPLIDSIKSIDEKIEELFAQHPDFEIFNSFPGAGAALAPRLQAAMGSDRSRFNSADEVQRYSGIAPVTVTGGKKKRVYRRLACSRFIKQSFHEFAWQSTKWCGWARACYDAQRSAGKAHHAAIRALAYKWIRIIYRCWKDGVLYDEGLYLRALQQKGSPLLEPAA
jgi:transposase